MMGRKAFAEGTPLLCSALQRPLLSRHAASLHLHTSSAASEAAAAISNYPLINTSTTTTVVVAISPPPWCSL